MSTGILTAAPALSEMSTSMPITGRGSFGGMETVRKSHAAWTYGCMRRLGFHASAAWRSISRMHATRNWCRPPPWWYWLCSISGAGNLRASVHVAKHQHLRVRLASTGTNESASEDLRTWRRCGS